MTGTSASGLREDPAHRPGLEACATTRAGDAGAGRPTGMPPASSGLEALRDLVLQELPFSVIATDTAGTIVAVNPAAERLLGYGREELIGKPASFVHEPADLQRHAAQLSQHLGVGLRDAFQVLLTSASRDRAEPREWSYLRKNGTTVPVDLTLSTLGGTAGENAGFLLVAHDVTEHKRAEALIRRIAHFDPVTGLPNRTLLLDRLEMAVRLARRNGTQLAVLMVDLDHFKRVNDSLGHPIGDRLLLTVSKRIQRCLRDADTVARFGGDEFVVVLNNVQGRGELEPVLAQIAAAVSAPVLAERHELVVSSSIGGCLFPEDGEDSAVLLRNADAAMYHAKASGRSNAQWFTPAMRRQAEEKLALDGALRRALEDGDFRVHYQPEVSLSDGGIVGMEALVRWHHAVQGDVSPGHFIPVAEDSGLIVPLGEWVLRTACRESAAMQDRLGLRLRLAVNVSPRQFQQKGWLDVVRRSLHDSGLDPRLLELEITEGILMHNPQESAELLKALRDLGATVVIDDFGTGYSSLSYLTRFPIDKIKIDRSFVHGLASDSADAAIVNAIIAMAHTLNIRVIAEGVESREQQSYLLERGCDEAQGFLYSAAMPPLEFEAAVLNARQPGMAGR